MSTGLFAPLASSTGDFAIRCLVVAGIVRWQLGGVEEEALTAAGPGHDDLASRALRIGAPTLFAADTSVRDPETPLAKLAPPA